MGQVLRTTVLMILMLCTFGVANGQHRKHPPFNPAKFEADLEQFITVNACLSPSQAASFFPVYRQMMKKQRALFDEMRRLRMINPKDNEACEEAIRKQDELDIQNAESLVRWTSLQSRGRPRNGRSPSCCQDSEAAMPPGYS